MKLTNAFKDRKFKDEIIGNVVLFFVYEFMSYVLLFELPLNYLRFELRSFILGGIAAIIGIILFALGFGNKNIKLKLYGLESIIFAVFSFLANYVLTKAPQIIMIGSKTIYLFIPFVVYFVYYMVKIIVLIKNKLKR